ncbi:hypothetical protein GCM10023191_029340 [Actinoallomurus oryzae]|uniref:Uncharacterized protein n=1 Tax=Actinoallomurus oryzae TaxID=502180 RepID=A0ABP8PWL1_9ACTN
MGQVAFALEDAQCLAHRDPADAELLCHLLLEKLRARRDRSADNGVAQFSENGLLCGGWTHECPFRE